MLGLIPLLYILMNMSYMCFFSVFFMDSYYIINNVLFTYFPKALNKNLTESFVFLCVSAIFVTFPGNDRLSMACKSPWGAISITIASSGI